MIRVGEHRELNRGPDHLDDGAEFRVACVHQPFQKVSLQIDLDSQAGMLDDNCLEDVSDEVGASVGVDLVKRNDGPPIVELLAGEEARERRNSDKDQVSQAIRASA